MLHSHSISGAPGGYDIRESARESMKFYATNNVFTGEVRTVFEALVSDLVEK